MGKRDKTPDELIEDINDAVDDGSGCAETWESMVDLRAKSHNQNDSGSARRGFLSRISATAGIFLASVFGFSNVASAKNDAEMIETYEKEVEKVQKAKHPYETPEAVRSAIRKHGGEVIDELLDQNFIESASNTSFSTDDLLGPREYSNANNGVHVGGFPENGTYTAHISIKKETKNNIIELFVQPQLDQSYAFIKPKSESERIFLIDKSDKAVSLQHESNTDITPQDFCRRDGCFCPPGSCSSSSNGRQVKYARVCCVRCGCCKRGAPVGCCFALFNGC